MVGFVHIELSTISAFSVEGSPSDTRTVRDIGPQRGRFTLSTLNHPRYWSPAWKVPLWTPNRPRYMPSAWMVHPIDIEPSVILVSSVDGSPSGIRTIRDSCPERGRFNPGPRTIRATRLCQPHLLLYFKVKTWRKMPDPLGYDEKGSCQA